MESQALLDLDEIFGTLKNINSDAEIIVQTMYEPYQYFTVNIAEGKTVADWMGEYVGRYNDELKAKAEAFGFTVVDVGAAFRENGNEDWLYASMKEGTILDVIAALANTDPHPTKEGHRGIFEAYLDEAGDIIGSAFAEKVTTAPATTTEAVITTNAPEMSSEPIIAPTTPSEATETVSATTIATDTKTDNNTLKIAVGVSAAVLLVAGIVIIVVSKKKRK